MTSVSSWLFSFFVRVPRMIFDRNVEEPSTNPESAPSFPLARSWVSTLSCQVAFHGLTFSACRKVTPGASRRCLWTATAQLSTCFLHWFFLNAKRSVRWLVMKTQPVLLTTRVRKLEKPLICVFLAAACRIVAELDRTLACSWLDTLST